MAAKHKYSGSHVEVKTSLEPAKVLALATQAAETFKEISVVGEDASTVALVIKSWAKVQLMNFSVNVSATDGSTVARTEIDGFRTQQSTFMFIPIGPKELLGYKSYKRYMALFAEAVKAVDSKATYHVQERA